MTSHARIQASLLVASMALAPGCAYVMFEKQFRPVEVQIRVPAQPAEAAIRLWVPEPGVAFQIHNALDSGEFPVEVLGAPKVLVPDGDNLVTAVAPSYSFRTCERRTLGLPRTRNAYSRPLFIAVVQQTEDGVFQVIEVDDGRHISWYEVTVAENAIEVLEVISGHPTGSVQRGADQDTVVVHLSKARRFDI